MSSKARLPWSNLRQVLWVVGVFGFILSILLTGFDLFFGGWDIDGRMPPSPQTTQGFVCDLIAGAVLIYYVVAAEREWSHRLWRVGVGLHLGLLSAFVYALSVNGQAFALLPVPLGMIVWLLYWRENNLSKIANQ